VRFRSATSYDDGQKHYFKRHFVYRKGKPETYIFFMERAVDLLGQNGLLGQIIPNAWLTNHYGGQLRAHLLECCQFLEMVDLEPIRVFRAAVVDTVIAVAQRVSTVESGHEVNVLRGASGNAIGPRFVAAQSGWREHPECVINLQASPSELAVLRTIGKTGVRLGSVVEFSQGMIPFETSKEAEGTHFISTVQEGPDWLPLYESAHQLRRYELDPPEAFILYGPWLARPREQRFFSEPKVLFHRLRKKLPRQLVGALDTSGSINRHSLSNLILRPDEPADVLPAVLALFNSRLVNWWFVKTYGLLMEVGGFKVAQLPLPERWREGRSGLCELATALADAHRRMREARMPQDLAAARRDAERLDAQTDRLVYELYGLSDNETALVAAP
jgi:hypothetical protein